MIVDPLAPVYCEDGPATICSMNERNLLSRNHKYCRTSIIKLNAIEPELMGIRYGIPTNRKRYYHNKRVMLFPPWVSVITNNGWTQFKDIKIQDRILTLLTKCMICGLFFPSRSGIYTHCGVRCRTIAHKNNFVAHPIDRTNVEDLTKDGWAIILDVFFCNMEKIQLDMRHIVGVDGEEGIFVANIFVKAQLV